MCTESTESGSFTSVQGQKLTVAFDVRNLWSLVSRTDLRLTFEAGSYWGARRGSLCRAAQKGWCVSMRLTTLTSPVLMK